MLHIDYIDPNTNKNEVVKCRMLSIRCCTLQVWCYTCCTARRDFDLARSATASRPALIKLVWCICECDHTLAVQMWWVLFPFIVEQFQSTFAQIICLFFKSTLIQVWIKVQMWCVTCFQLDAAHHKFGATGAADLMHRRLRVWSHTCCTGAMRIASVHR